VRIRNELEGVKEELATLESEQSSRMNEYMDALRRRYHEEQLWQDKWGVYSTYGTWGLIVLNSVVFLASQYLWRARESRRMKEVQELLKQSLMANEGTLRAVQEQQQSIVAKNGDDNDRGALILSASQDIPHGGEESVGDLQPKDALQEGSSLRSETDNNQLETAPPFKYRKIFTEKKVDAPSAMLGASIVGVAWLVAAALSSS